VRVAAQMIQDPEPVSQTANSSRAVPVVRPVWSWTAMNAPRSLRPCSVALLMSWLQARNTAAPASGRS
jgi:hypothetical protein